MTGLRGPNGELSIHGERVVLRTATAADAPAIDAVLATPEVARWWDDEPATARLERLDVPLLAIDLDGDLIGFLQYEEEEDPDYRSAGVDIALHPDHHGQGLGADAIRTVVGWLVHVRGHHRITIDPAADNAAAIACYRKAGFREVGVMRRYERGRDGTFHDGLLMELVVKG